MVSIFKNTFEKKPLRNMDELSFFDAVKNGEWQDDVLNYRANRTPEMKKKNLCVTASGTFTERKASNLIQHSGLICIDIDAKDQIGEVDIERIRNDEYCYCLHQSIGGYGYAMYVKINPEKHLDSFIGLEKYMLENHSIIIDKSCKDTSRLRFVSFDPDLFLNPKAKIFKKYIKKSELKKESKVLVVKSDFDEMVNRASSMNLFESYDDYIRCAFALSLEFGEDGRSYFHNLCSGSDKYSREKADKDYSIALNRSGTDKVCTIGFVYHIFKEAGIPITSERTETIKKMVRLADNPLSELQNLGIMDAEDVVQKIELPSESTEIDYIIEMIRLEKIVFNEIKRNYEFKGVEMTDRVLAEFYQKVWTKIDPDISKDKIFTLIQSRKNTPSYNPILQWFDKNKHLKTDNEFEKLKNCFNIKTEIVYNGEIKGVSDYLDVFLKKWLLGIVASAHGTYSLMVLVLIGTQTINKTKFFRNLLPRDLMEYYAESTLDKEKDSEILMCKKLLIVDDEFGGKSKKDAVLMKRMSSVQTFSIRAPYGRVSEDLNRLAVLAGTTNEDEVINDPTGNRRIIPINLISFDYETYEKIDKDRLFIELYNEWKTDKEGWFLSKDEIYFLNQSTLRNTEVMAEAELIEKHFVADELGQMTNTDVMMKLTSVYFSLKTNNKRIGQAMKKCGFVQKIKLIDGKTCRCYECKFYSITDFEHNV